MQVVETPLGRFRMIGSGFALAHGGGSIETFPAMPGDHTEAVLGEAGYSTAEIADFLKSGVAAKGLREGGKAKK